MVTDYNYYANGWLKSVQLGASTPPVASYAYDAAGNRTQIGLGNGTSTAYAYDTDPRYRISSITHTPVGSPAVTLSYASRDNAGNPLSMQDWNGTTSYTYDNNSRLEQTGGYDWVGNRNTATWDYNADDQLTATPNNQYTYLMTGSLLEQYNGTGTTLQKEYTYTYANLLSSVTHADVSGNPVSSMTWDTGSNRISFTSSSNGEMTQFVYDTTAGIPAVIEEVAPSGSVCYIREPSGALIARITGSGTGQTMNYYHFDALGSTRLLTGADGAVTDKYTYDAWGAMTNHTQLTDSIDQPYQYVGQMGYYTHYQDTNLPLLQLGVRFYDPSVGRFTKVDPIPSDYGSYLYAMDRSTALTDPTGLRPPMFGEIPPYDFNDCRGRGGVVTSAPYCRTVPDWACLANETGKWMRNMITDPGFMLCSALGAIAYLSGQPVGPSIDCARSSLEDPVTYCTASTDSDWSKCKRQRSQRGRRCEYYGGSWLDLNPIIWYPCPNSK